MATLTDSNNQDLFKFAALNEEGDGSAAYRSDLIHSQIIDLLKNVSDNVMSLQDITKELVRLLVMYLKVTLLEIDVDGN